MINRLLSLWSATLVPHGDAAPIVNHADLHTTIDAIDLGDVPWESYTIQYNGVRPENGPVPEWMTTEYQFWYRDPQKVIHRIFANPNLADFIDCTPYQEFKNGECQYGDFMSGNWAWEQCVRPSLWCYFCWLILRIKDTISADPDMHGAMFVSIILGSDKTTVSVATGQHEYHPIYLSVGNVRNRARRAHKDGLVLIGFLPIPKGI